MITLDDSVRQTYPGFHFGALVVRGLDGNPDRPAMDSLVAAELAAIRAGYPAYERKTFVATEPVCHYVGFYKRFTKTYHVLLQLESVLLKDRGIPPVGVPVEAMFLAEVKNLLLTAGHDLDAVQGQLTVRVARGDESFIDMYGKEQRPTPGDLYLTDGVGIMSDVIYGADGRTRITDTTTTALFCVYGVAGITEDQIRGHLEDIQRYIAVGQPQAGPATIDIYAA